ncbi:MAG: flippase-like domain-containing protein [Pirellulales bacterium]|nr:flippase-like domain-containing protein [Pirellulales bacterium]
MKKVLLIAAKLLIVALVAWFVRGTLVSAWRQIGEHPLEIHPIWLLLSGLIYLVALLPAGWYWHHVLKTLGQEAGLGETLQAYYLGHLGKYVPGKAMVVILRTGLIRSHRVDTALAVVSVFYETLTMMAVGSFLAVGILAFRLQGERTMLWASFGFMLLAGLPTLPPIFRQLLQVMQFLKRKSSPLPSPLSPLSSPARNLTYQTVAIGWLSMLYTWTGMAASLWAVFRSCGLEFGLIDHFPDYAAAVSLSVVVGFLSFIPGGLVVRDMILAVLLVRLFQIDEAPAAVASGLLRLVWLVAELTVFGVLYPIRMKLRLDAKP